MTMRERFHEKRFTALDQTTRAARQTAVLHGIGLHYSTDTREISYSDGAVWSSASNRGQLSGMQMTVTTTHDTTITAGSCRVGTSSDPDINTAYLTSSFVKELDATWAETSAAGGRDDGIANAANLWWHVFILHNPVTGAVDAGFDTSVTCANLLAMGDVSTAGYTQYRRIGSVKETAAGDGTQRDYMQSGDEFWWKTNLALDYDPSTTDYTSQTTFALTGTPPDVRVVAHIIAHNENLGNHSVVGPGGGTLSSPALAATPLAQFRSTLATSGRFSLLTDTSQQIMWIVTTDTSSALQAETSGYTDSRGKSD